VPDQPPGAAVSVAASRGAPVHHVLVTADDAAVRARLLSRASGRAADDHSDADVGVYARMRERGFEPPPQLGQMLRSS
jgi:predicted kinase